MYVCNLASKQRVAKTQIVRNPDPNMSKKTMTPNQNGAAGLILRRTKNHKQSVAVKKAKANATHMSERNALGFKRFISSILGP